MNRRLGVLFIDGASSTSLVLYGYVRGGHSGIGLGIGNRRGLSGTPRRLDLCVLHAPGASYSIVERTCRR